jgi:hypothetical protein
MTSGGNDHPKKKKARSASDEHQLTVALASARVAEAAAAEARANEKKMAKMAAFWKAEAIQERRRARRAEAYAEDRKLHKQDCEIHILARERLIKALCALESDQAEERARAVLVAAKQRLMLGKTWDALIVRELDDNADLDDEEFTL